MTPEQQKKEDIELWKLKNHIIGMIADYNWRLGVLEDARKPYISYTKGPIRGLGLVEPDLEKVR
jgi:hypothetical protein